MKKVISMVTIIVMMLILVSSTVFAVAQTYAIELTSNKKEVYQGDEIVLTLKVKDFENMTDGVMGFTAKIEYDTAFFENLTQESIKGKGTWSSVPTFNPETNQITADSGVGVKTDSEVFTITLKVKTNAIVGVDTIVKVKNFEAAEGDTELKPKEEATITISLKEKQGDPTPPTPDTNNIKPDTNNIINIDNTTTTNTTNTTNTAKDNLAVNNGNNTQSTTNIPQTGEQDWIFVVVIGIALAGIFSYIKYKSIN